MNISLLRSRRHAEPTPPRVARRRRHTIALFLPALVVASTVLSGPAHADGDGSTPASSETSPSAPAPDPAPAADSQPEPKPEPAPEPQPAPDPKPEPAPEPRPAPEPKPEPEPEPVDDAPQKGQDESPADQAPQSAEASEQGAVAVSPSAGTVFSAAVAAKEAEEKASSAKDESRMVVICKYVSKPGGFGHHVIVTDGNSLKGWDGSFPSLTFADAQNSIVLRPLADGEVPGQVPDSTCPTLLKPPTPKVVNPCGPDNAVWGELSGVGFTVTRPLDGSLVVTASPGYWFAPLTVPPTVEIVFAKPVDSDPANQDCSGPAAVVPPDPEPVEECGDGIVQWADPPSNPGYTWVRNGDGSVTFTPVPPAVFPGGAATISWPAPEAQQEDCPKKVVVCKYVSTPAGVLHHIIIVSVNAVDPSGSGKTWDQVTDADFPFPFEDAQDSLAIGFADKGDQSHDFTPEDCGTKVDAPVVPQTDPCNPAGVTSNVQFGAIPTGPWTADMSVPGKVTFTATGNGYFSTTGEGEDQVFVKTFVVQLGADSGEKCLVAPALTVNDPCGPANATWLAPAASADFTVSVVDGVIKLIAAVGKAFEGNQPTYTYPATAPADSGMACGQVGGQSETKNPPKNAPHDQVAGQQASAGLPNTGGPTGWLMPLGVGLVLAGAGLVLARRPRTT